MKRIISLLLSALMIVTSFAFTVSAEQSTSEEGNPLEGKSVLFLGDSITHAATDTPSGQHLGWASRIGNANNMTWLNHGEAGYSVSDCRLDSNYGAIIERFYQTKDQEFDYVILHGGVNDAWDKAPVGTMTEGFDPSEFDTNTFAGGLENLFYNALYYHGGRSAIGYLMNYKLTGSTLTQLHDMSAYFDVAKDICEKWGISYLDMYNNDALNAELAVDTTAYLPDGIHPNKEGYDILAPYIESFMKTLDVTYPPVPQKDGGDCSAVFTDGEGTTLATLSVKKGEKIKSFIPVVLNKSYDGIVEYEFIGWEADGAAVDLDEYTVISDVTFEAAYTVAAGARFEEVAPVLLGDGSAAQELLPESVKLGTYSHGITVVYKIEGAESQIIADDFSVYTNNSASKRPAVQWGNASYAEDGLSPNHLELNNGCYYIYLNQNINGTHAKYRNTLDSFSVFNPHDKVYDAATARDAKNTNTAATVQILAVTSDNLQPTVNYHGADGKLIGSYTYKYTDVAWNLGFGTRPLSCQEGQLMGADDIFALTGFTAPEAPEGTVLIGWTEEPDAEEAVLAKDVYYNCDLYPVFDTVTEDDYKTVTFVDWNGETVYTGEVLFGKLISDGYPDTLARAADGVHFYRFKGWTVDGESIIDPAKYEYEGGETVKPLYTVYGEIFEEPETMDISDTTKELNLMPKSVLINPEANGITWMYRVEGADTTVIADSMKVSATAAGNPASQWSGTNYASDGGYAYQFELNNGYFYLYVNDNLNNMNGKNSDVNYAKFSIYGTNAGYTEARTPVNDNESAKVTVLGVIPDNLQPTATFHDARGNVLASYQHKYTNVTRHLGWGNGNPASVQEGTLLTIDEVFTLTAEATPEKEATHNGKVTYAFDGWVDAEGNAIDALYYNVDLYPSFKIASDTRESYTVKFVDEDGSELYSTTILEGETPVYEGEEPAKAADKKNTYEFAGWNTEIAPAAGDVTYKATYTATAIEYVVTFMNGEDEIGRAGVLYEGKITPPVPPAKEATAQYTYTFDKWVDKNGNAVDLNKITDNITAYAKYTETVNQYTVTFMTENKTEISKSTVDYGTAAEKPADPTKEPSDACTYEFAGWVDADGNAVDVDKVVADVTVYPSFKEIPNEITVTFMNGDERYGSFVFDYGKDGKAPEKAPEFNGEAKPFTKYTFDKWVDAEGNEADLTSLTEDITVYASYSEECEHSFSDIKEGEWYEAAVEWALMNGVMNGEGANFNPNKATTRGMIVTVLYRIEGSPDVSAVEHPFTDIKEGDWYYDAVKWAYSEGVVNGNSNTTYAPTATLTREQFATILYRYAKELKGEDVSVDDGANLDAYTDKDEVSGYALDAVLWTNVKGYIGGTSATKLSPKGSATRAQMATILYRYINK